MGEFNCEGWINNKINVRENEWIGSWIDRYMHGWVDRCMNGLIDAWRVNGRMEK